MSSRGILCFIVSVTIPESFHTVLLPGAGAIQKYCVKLPIKKLPISKWTDHLYRRFYTIFLDNFNTEWFHTVLLAGYDSRHSEAPNTLRWHFLSMFLAPQVAWDS